MVNYSFLPPILCLIKFLESSLAAAIWQPQVANGAAGIILRRAMIYFVGTLATDVQK